MGLHGGELIGFMKIVGYVGRIARIMQILAHASELDSDR